MLLADEAAAAARLADYAAMSAYAYVEPADQDCGKAPKLEPVEIQRLREWLSSAGWERVMAAEFVPPCRGRRRAVLPRVETGDCGKD